MDPSQADVIALLEAHLRGDAEAVGVVVDGVGAYPLLAMTVGFFVEMVGAERVAEVLTQWRATMI